MQAKKNLGLMQMQYKNVYVAYVSMGTNPAAAGKAFNEALHTCRCNETRLTAGFPGAGGFLRPVELNFETREGRL